MSQGRQRRCDEVRRQAEDLRDNAEKMGLAELGLRLRQLVSKAQGVEYRLTGNITYRPDNNEIAMQRELEAMGLVAARYEVATEANRILILLYQLQGVSR